MRRRTHISNRQLGGVETPEWPYDANTVLVYGIWGQSNIFGADNNYSSLSAEIKGPQQSRVFKNPSHNSTGTWQALQAGVNHQNVTSPNTSTGPILSFGYEMSLLYPNKIQFIHHSVGGTALKQNNTSGVKDWNPASTNEYWEDLMRDFSNGWTKLIAEGKTPILKGIVQGIGETDALGGGSTFDTDLDAFWTATISRLNTYGISTANMRAYIGKIKPAYFDPVRPDVALIRDAIEDFCAANDWADYYEFSDCAYVNDSHMSTAGQVTHGQILANYFKQFI